VREILGWVLLTAAVVLQLACVVGLVLAPGPLARLHFTAPASALAPGLVTAAVLVAGAPSGLALKAILVAVVLGITNPVVTHATARAARIREGRRS
jgi:multicomponent Na+:H+ antiporter subunit G